MLSVRLITAVLAVAVAAGVLIGLVLSRPGPSAVPKLTPVALTPLPDNIAGHPVTTVAAGDGVLAYGTAEGGVYLAPGDTEPRRVAHLSGQVDQLAFDNSGRWLAATSKVQELAVVDVHHPTTPVAYRHLSAINWFLEGPEAALSLRHLAIDATGTQVVAESTGSLGVYNPRDSRLPLWLQECAPPTDLAFVGNRLIAVNSTCVDIFDAATLRLTRRVLYPGVKPYVEEVGEARIGPNHRIQYGGASQDTLLDYGGDAPQTDVTTDPNNPATPFQLSRGNIIAEKTIKRMAGVQPVADDGRVAAVISQSHLIFWASASHQIVADIAVPIPPAWESETRFRTTFSGDRKALLITAVRVQNLHNSEEDPHLTYRHWKLSYPRP
jgi:hypothetical protein